MSYRTIEVEHGGGMLATIFLNRPAYANAIDALMLDELLAVFTELAKLTHLRAIVLAARGPHFCVGIDTAWRSDRDAEAATSADLNIGTVALQNINQSLANVLQAMRTCPAPIVAKIHGDCHGAGIGLIAACDIAVAAGHASFVLPETMPASAPPAYLPYLAQAMTARTARRYLLTAERLSAFEAKQAGLVHEAVMEESLEEHVDAVLAALLQVDNKRIFGESI